MLLLIIISLSVYRLIRVLHVDKKILQKYLVSTTAPTKAEGGAKLRPHRMCSVEFTPGAFKKDFEMFLSKNQCGGYCP